MNVNVDVEISFQSNLNILKSSDLESIQFKVFNVSKLQGAIEGKKPTLGIYSIEKHFPQNPPEMDLIVQLGFSNFCSM